MYNVTILTTCTRKTVELKAGGTSGIASKAGNELGTNQAFKYIKSCQCPFKKIIILRINIGNCFPGHPEKAVLNSIFF